MGFDSEYDSIQREGSFSYFENSPRRLNKKFIRVAKAVESYQISKIKAGRISVGMTSEGLFLLWDCLKGEATVELSLSQLNIN